MSYVMAIGAGVDVRVHPRAMDRHLEISADDVRTAFSGTLRKAPRLDVEPVQWVDVDLDDRGRLLEYIAVETGPDDCLVLHAMPAAKGTLREVGIGRS